MFDHQGAEKLHTNTRDDTNLNKLNKDIKRIKKKIFCFYCFLFLDVFRFIYLFIFFLVELDFIANYLLSTTQMFLPHAGSGVFEQTGQGLEYPGEVRL